jgi:hypothetical protein
LAGDAPGQGGGKGKEQEEQEGRGGPHRPHLSAPTGHGVCSTCTHYQVSLSLGAFIVGGFYRGGVLPWRHSFKNNK